MSSAQTRRAERRQATIDEIKQRSREQLTINGYGGLSLRAVAREMRVSSAAVYRYFPNQSDLITALCVDAYTHLAETVEAARDRAAAGGPAQQIWEIYQSVRRWALDNRADFALLYGTPIPGYQAPHETTGPAEGRGIAVVVGVYADAHRSGLLHLDGPEAALGPVLLAAVAHSAWVSVLGFISSELWTPIPHLIADTDSLYDAHLHMVLRGHGFQQSQIPGGQGGHSQSAGSRRRSR